MHARRGFTLVEAVVAMALVGLVTFKVCILMGVRSNGQSHDVTAMTVEDQARRLMEQIAYALMAADEDRVTPDSQSPSCTDQVRFEVRLGVENGEVIWDEPHWVGITDQQSQVAWRENADDPQSRRVVWSNSLRPFLEGEVVNGVDDNGNGLIDERGLSISLEGGLCTIRLTLERTESGGKPIQKTVETSVAFRNGGTGE